METEKSSLPTRLLGVVAQKRQRGTWKIVHEVEVIGQTDAWVEVACFDFIDGFIGHCEGKGWWARCRIVDMSTAQILSEYETDSGAAKAVGARE